MNIKSIDIWKLALSFHYTYRKDLLKFLPFIFIPVFGDGLHSILISKLFNNDRPQFGESLGDALRLFLKIFYMKFYFWFFATLWSFVPIYGIIKGLHYRKYWAMASNVAVFESLTGTLGIDRCIDLVTNDHSHIGARTFITLPSLFVLLFTLLFLLLTENFPLSFWFWFYIFSIIWLTIPVSSALNTIYYVKLAEKEQVGCVSKA